MIAYLVAFSGLSHVLFSGLYPVFQAPELPAAYDEYKQVLRDEGSSRLIFDLERIAIRDYARRTNTSRPTYKVVPTRLDLLR